MADQNKEELLARVARLEKKVEELEQRVKATSATKTQEQGTEPKPKQISHQPEKTEAPKWKPENLQTGEQWLNRIGIGLLLIGVAFLFKYSIDQGWLIPPVRSAIGLGIGLVLFISGIQMRTDSKMKQILLGGSIGVFYLTGFATFQLYSFMPSSVIWIFMVVVTLLALSHSLQQDEAVLSIIGTLGALGTPFMLYSGSGNIAMLMVYTSLVLAAAAIIYLQKGWKTLLWCITIGGFVVMVVGMVNISFGTEDPALADLWILQAGVILWMIVSWLLPAGREMLTLKNPTRWPPDPAMRLDDVTVDQKLNYRTGASVHLVVFLVPLFLLVLIIGIWDLSMDGAGIASLSIAGAGSLCYLPLKMVRLNKLASTHILLGLLMFTIGFVLLLEGNFLFMVLAAETVALRYIARQTGDVNVSVSSHILFVTVIFWMLYLLRFTPFDQVPILNIEALSQLAFLAAGGILIPLWLNRTEIKHIYQGTSHIVFLIWLYQTFSTLENGQAWVTVAWGAYAIALLVLGFIRFGKNMRLVGMGTIFLVVGKLFLVDLSQLQAIWRILLFIGFGAVFLLLGYYWQSKWSEDETETKLSNT